jgi:3-phenylpropionate/cinnamic acid dioxygenase small subunit
MSVLDSATLDRATVEAFLYQEARLADEGAYEAWGKLWTDDGVYWIPANLDDYDPKKHLSIIYDDRAQLQDRLDRLMSGKAWAQEPKSRVCRLISNVELGPVTDRGDVEVRSAFVLGEVRNGLQTSYYGRQVHHLRRSRDGIRIAFKKVLLINNDEPLHNLTFIV